MSDIKIAFVGTHLFFDEVTKSRLAALGNLEVIDREPDHDLLISCAQQFDVVATWGKVTRDVLASGTRLKFVNLLSTGYFNHNLSPDVTLLDLVSSGIIISYTPDYSTEAVANYSVAAALAGIHKIALNDDALRSNKSLGAFQTRPYDDYKVGILGAGNIGACAAAKFSALGFDVRYYSRSPKPIAFGRVGSMEELFSTSDILSIHMALTPETDGTINSTLLSMLPANAVIVNSARARLFNIDDLINHLRRHPGCIAIVDQLTPFTESGTALPANLKITPHIAYDNLGAHYKRTQIATDNIEAFLKGDPLNQIEVS